MTENRRIFLNIIATYGRSLYGLVIGLLCGRWALMALGEVDYGLNGLVGGLAAFISFFNSVLASANGRFYAFSVGAAKVAQNKDAALEECRHWFNTAFSIHVIVPAVLVVIGYPIGCYAIRHWLTIPPVRVEACIWVFRYVCLSCFVGMVNVPFSAMYTAKQYIAELTIYSFVTSTLNVIVLHYMVTHPDDDWLTQYAAWTCLMSVVPQIIICIRACYVFRECRIRLDYMWDKTRLKTIGSFAGWQLMGMLCGLLRGQGITIVINKFFGAAMNAAHAVGNSVQANCYSLAGAMQGAFVPVITQACGAGDLRKMNEYVIRTCKFNVILSLIFIIPLALELPEVMRLWLKNPPAYSIGLCYCAMVLHFVSSCTVGHMVAVNASGRIAGYHVIMSTVSVFTVPLAVVVGLVWRDVYFVMGAVILMEAINSIGRIVFARLLVGTSVRVWLSQVLFPVIGVSSICLAMGWLPRLGMATSLLRVCVTTVTCEIVFLPLLWRLLLSFEERQFVKEKIAVRLRKLAGGR